MPDRETIGRNLRNARENCGITQLTAARHLRLSRTLIAQIELGNRPVSPDELTKLAGLYRQSVVDMVGVEPPSDNDLLLVLFDLAPELLSKTARARISEALALTQEVTFLEQRLGRTPRIGPPLYAVPTPRTAAEAFSQGEHVAEQDRVRLGLGVGPLLDMSDILASQAIRFAAVELPDDIAGVLLRHESVGTAVWVNLRHAEPQQRHACAHVYAHALIDHERTVVVTKRSNAGDLLEKRANAFVSAFLLPGAGVHSALASWDKGQPSRRFHAAIDGLTEEAITAESRTPPGSQTITYLDVAALANRFGTSYAAVVHRLLSLGAVSGPEAKGLLGQKIRKAVRELTTILRRPSDGHRLPAAVPAADVKLEVLGLAIEARRRQILSTGDLTALAARLQVPQLSAARLLELADAAR